MAKLYRHYDENGVLLYVGISLNAISRLLQHRSKSCWYNSIASVEIEEHETKADALKAERHAIKTENPLHNIAGKLQISRQYQKKTFSPDCDLSNMPMANNGRRIVTASQFRQMLYMICRKHGSQKTWAAENNISPTIVSEVISGRRDVSQKLLAVLGATVEILYEVEGEGS